MKNRLHFGIHIGSVSILLIFVILCLVSLSTLSLTSATADYRLSSKIIERQSNYYEACNKIEQDLSNLDQTLLLIYRASQSEQDFYHNISIKEYTFSYPVSEYQSVTVTAVATYPTKYSQHLYTITSWKTITTKDFEYDESLNVKTLE